MGREDHEGGQSGMVLKNVVSLRRGQWAAFEKVTQRKMSVDAAKPRYSWTNVPDCSVSLARLLPSSHESRTSQVSRLGHPPTPGGRNTAQCHGRSASPASLETAVRK